jgi:monoamine oxidase
MNVFQVARILFAGEATHEKYYSTVNAALETGVKAAENVLSIID